MNKTGEIKAPVTEKDPKQGVQASDEQSQQALDQPGTANSSANNSSETEVEAENPAQFEKLSRWFDILKQVCQEKPRVVLKALQDPDKLMRRHQYDNGSAEIAKAQELKRDVRWNIQGLGQAKKEFAKNGLDSRKALAVIDYLRNNVGDRHYHTNKDGEGVIVRTRYQYNPRRDFQLIAELVSDGDNPIVFLEELGAVIDYQNGGWDVLKKIVYYRELTRNNPRAKEIINKVKDIKNLDKLDLDHSFVSETETGEVKVLFGSKHNEEENQFVADPIRSLLSLDEAHFQELFSEENLAKVQELWVKIAGEEKIKPELLPHLLKLATNPQLEQAFFIFFDDFSRNEQDWQKNQLIKDPYKFEWAIQRIELICKEIPEVLDLLQNGFDVDWVFEARNSFKYNESYEKAMNIEGLLSNKERFLNAFNNQQLREKARILDKYGFKMSFTPRNDEMNPIITDAYNFVRTSEPGRLEKSLLIFDLAGELLEESAGEERNISKIYRIWHNIGNGLDDISVEEVVEAFQLLADKKEELADFTIGLWKILDAIPDSSETLIKRIEYILDPEVRQLIQDPFFIEMMSNHRMWERFFETPDDYLALNKQKDLVIKRLEDLKRENISFEGYTDVYLGILQLTEEEFQKLQAEFKSGNLPNNFKVNEVFLSFFNVLKNVSQQDQELFLRQLSEFGINVTNLSLFDYRRFDLKSLELYFQLNESQRQEVIDLAKRLKDKYDLKVFKVTYSDPKIDFQVVCQLIANQGYQEIFYKYLTQVNQLNIDDGAGLFFFKKIMEAYVDEGDFNLQEYVGSDGLVTDKFLTKISEISTLSGDTIEQFRLLITDQVLEKMDIKDANFWRSFRKYANLLSFSSLTLNVFVRNRANFDSFVVNGLATDALLNAFVDYDGGYSIVVEKLLSSEPAILENMDEKNREFWSFWQDKDYYIQKTLIKNKEKSDQLVVNGQPTAKLINILAREQTNEFLIDDEFSNLTNFSLAERQEIRVNILRGAQESSIEKVFFMDICRHLGEDLSENGQVSEILKEPFQQAFACELSADFIQRLDRFYQESQNKKYADLIPNIQLYWNDNGFLMSKLEAIGWRVDHFDKFRSLVQNPETNNILKHTEKDLLVTLTREIALTPNNIYYVSRDSLNWLKDNLNSTEKIAFFKKILNEKPSSFNSCVSALGLVDEKKIKQIITNPLYTERLFDAMKEFGNITTSLINSYILNPSETARLEYREKIIKFREDVHRNVEVMPLTEGPGGVDFLADMIALTFPGTDFKKIKSEFGRGLQDRCDHIANLQIREQGYQGQIVSKEKIAQLRDENKPIDEGVINLIKIIFADQQEEAHLAAGGDVKLALQAWARLLVKAGSTNQKVLFRDSLAEVIACSRVSLGDRTGLGVEKMIGDTSQIDAKNNILAKAKELFGIYYKDRASEAIKLFLQKHQQEADILLARLSDKRLNSLEKNIAGAKTMSEENRVDFKEIIEGLRNKELPVVERQELLARLLAFMTERSIFAGTSGLRKQVSKEIKKVVLRDKEGQDIDPDLIISGYLTKNAASYFAKTTASICTAGNIELFNRPDHFHVNLVNKEGTVVGNIQGYQIIYNGQPALIFRGFNPSTSIISTDNAEILCDQMLDMIKQIAADNNIDQILVTGQEGGFHALTNRVGLGIEKYFANRFFNSANKVDFSFNITEKTTVGTLYRIT